MTPGLDLAISPAERDTLEELLERRRRKIEAELGSKRDWEPLPHQIPPEGKPGIDWFLWLMLGGRGAGKTDGCAAYMNAHALGPPCLDGPVPHRMAIIAPTLGDASESCVNGPSGLRAHNPSVVEQSRKGGTFVTWPNGAQAKIFGAYTKQDPERLRAGGNRCMAWLEEIAAWRYLAECWKHTRLGLLRLGPHPHAIASTTPRSRPTVKTLIAMSTATHSITRATTADNPKLPKQIREALYKEYAGTRLGQQELEGEMIDDVIGALWNLDLIEEHRVLPEDAPADQLRLEIAVDPSWGTTNDEVGIVAGYLGPDGHAYIVEDLSGIFTPAEWAELVARAYARLSADRVIAEGNFQGEQVKLAMKSAYVATQIQVNFELVHASRGKVLRAEPVIGLYEQGRVHHVGRLAGLEHQMCVARGTAVITRDGGVPIEDVVVGDEVWTRAGWRRVLWSGRTGKREVIEVVAGGHRLHCTPDHRVWSERVGWERADQLQTGDRMIGCRVDRSALASSSKGVAITRTRTSISSAPVPVAVVTTIASGATDVFDLTVEGEHEYFAGGLLVHNCHWVPPRNVDDEHGFDAGDPDKGVEREEAEMSEEPVPSDYSPDRVDALVFLVTDLLLGPGGPGSIVMPPSSKRVQRRLLQTPNSSRDTLSPHQRRLHDRHSRH